MSAPVLAVEVEAAYEQAAAAANERQVIEARFDVARGDWRAEMRVLADAKAFDDANPSRDPLFEELHAEQLYGRAV